MREKVTAPLLRSMRKKGQKIVCITAYDSTFGEIADEAGADVILVGDSVANVLLGYDSTLPVTLEQIEHHTRATRKGVVHALLVADLPFGSYEGSIELAMRSAVSLMKAGAEAVKLEGDYPETFAALDKAGIPCMGHLGFTPQSVHRFGGHKIQGKGDDGSHIKEQALRLDHAGAIGLVLELIPSELAGEITNSVSCPTIGIGAGPACSGQIQVLHDVLGLSPRELRHAKPYINGRALIREAISEYAEEVRGAEFPTSQHSR